MTRVWSERLEPAGGGWKDCTYCGGLMALVFGGFTKFPLGAYTVKEREALERSDSQPDETGASLDDLILAVHTRYGIAWAKSRTSVLASHHDRDDLAFVVQGQNGNLPTGHRLRRWDPTYTGGHCVTVIPTGDGTHLRWLDPLAPMGFAGDVTDWATVMKWIGSMPFCISVRKGAYAPKETDMSEIQRLGTAIKTISEKYLPRALAAKDKAELLKWSLRLADYSTRLAVLVSPALARKEAVELDEPPVYDPPLTYDQEHDVFIAAQDEILKAQGKPAGHDGAERGSLPLFTNIELAEKLGLPLHVAEFKSFVAPDTAQ
jgi:hypothetical protein